MKYRPRPRALLRTGALALALASLAPSAGALPKLGAPKPELRLVDAWDRTLDTARLSGRPVLVVHEDKDSSKQNQAFKDDLAALARGNRYVRRIALVAIADVEGYDYWPVRGFVKDAIKSESAKVNTVIYCDWNGDVRRALGLRRGVSNVVLYGAEGTVLFAHEGALSTDQRRRVIELLRQQIGE